MEFCNSSAAVKTRIMPLPVRQRICLDSTGVGQTDIFAVTTIALCMRCMLTRDKNVGLQSKQFNIES